MPHSKKRRNRKYRLTDEKPEVTRVSQRTGTTGWGGPEVTTWISKQ